MFLLHTRPLWISLWLGGVECLVTDPHMTSVPIEDGLSTEKEKVFTLYEASSDSAAKGRRKNISLTPGWGRSPDKTCGIH